MARTPDRFPGVRTLEEGVDLVAKPLAAAVGEMRYNGGADRFSFFDGVGEYDPRSSGGLPAATAIGQILVSVDGLTFTVQANAVSDLGEIAVDDEGVIGVVG